MPKLKINFICTECGAQYPRWMGRCEQCGNWNTLIEEVIESTSISKAVVSKPSSVIDISEVKDSLKGRQKTGSEGLDQVLGGGIVSGSLILLGGDPGIGKSTLVLEIASKLKNSLYVSGEESEQQVRFRAKRLGINSGVKLLSETNIDVVTATILAEKPDLVVIDSIQTMYSQEIPGTPGSISQLSLCASKLMNIAKSNQIAIILIGHVTKEGNIAGPRVLEHLVDVVLYLEGERFGSFRILRGVKNRFGPTNEVGIFEMVERGMIEVKNPSEIMINERAHQAPGSVIFPAMEGTRPLLVEIQALSSATTFGYPKRTSSGFDLSRLSLIAAVLQKRCGLNLSTQDIYLNVAGGIGIKEPAADLAVALAIASSFKNIALKDNLVILGEIGLAGEVRSVNNVERRIVEATKLGFRVALVPNHYVSALKNGKNTQMQIIPVSTIKEAIDRVL